jgi:hypothetical protein
VLPVKASLILLASAVFTDVLSAGVLQSAISLVSSPNPSIFGQPVTLTATVSPSSAPGTVTFYDGTLVLGTAPVASGSAILTTSLLASGNRILSARYAGGGGFSPSATGPWMQTVRANPSVGLAAEVLYPTSIQPDSIAAADFNNDGKVDLVVGGIGGIGVFLGNGDGTFQTPVGTVASNFALAVIAGDFNADGKSDIAVVNSGADTITVFLGNGDGSFQTGVDYAVGRSPVAIASVDLNEDGKIDLAVVDATSETGDGTVSVLLGSGDGTFQSAVNYGAGQDSTSIAVGDMNGDGFPDLVVGNSSDGTVDVFLGNGNGTLQAALQVGGLYSIDSVAVADLDGDGKADVVAAGISGESAGPGEAYSIGILLGNGDGTFSAPVFYATPPGDYVVTVADVNGDGIPDLAVADPFGDATSTLLGYGDGTFGPATIYSTSHNAFALVAGDFNADGAVDLAVASLNVSIFLGQPASTTQVFADVTSADYDFNAANDLDAFGITSGCGASDFCPDQAILRWEAAVLTVRSVIGAGSFTTSGTPYFADVPVGSPGFQWIQKLYELGITAGCGSSSDNQPLFCPDEALTRADAAIYVIRARFGSTTTFTYPSTPNFTDVPAGAFGFEYIQRLREDEITTGCSPTSYCPTDLATRGEMAILLMRGIDNLLLPPTEPIIAGIYPEVLTHGTTNTFLINASGSDFIEGTTQRIFSAQSGITVNSVAVISPTMLMVGLTASAEAPIQPASIYVQTGPSEAVLPAKLSIR